jgi:hypothetical protein
VPAADTSRLHAAGRRQIGRTQAHALHARARRRDLFNVIHTGSGFEDCVDHQRSLEAMFGFELRQQLVHVMNVPRAFHLRHHDDIELRADFSDQTQDVVEKPGTIQAVDPGPKLSLAELHFPSDLYEAFARVQFAIRLDAIFEVAEQNIDLVGQIRHLGHHLRIARVEEMDHPRRPERDFTQRLGCTNGKGLEEFALAFHGMLMTLRGNSVAVTIEG